MTANATSTAEETIPSASRTGYMAPDVGARSGSPASRRTITGARPGSTKHAGEGDKNDDRGPVREVGAEPPGDHRGPDDDRDRLIPARGTARPPSWPAAEPVRGHGGSRSGRLLGLGGRVSDSPASAAYAETCERHRAGSSPPATSTYHSRECETGRPSSPSATTSRASTRQGRVEGQQVGLRPSPAAARPATPARARQQAAPFLGRPRDEVEDGNGLETSGPKLGAAGRRVRSRAPPRTRGTPPAARRRAATGGRRQGCGARAPRPR